MPWPRISQDSSRSIFKFQNGLLEQKLYADEVLVYFIQQSKTKSDLNFLKEEQ
jgi:hypothetical protein